MATFDYSKSAALASRLLERFGQQVTLSKSVPGAYDPVTGEHTGSEELTQTAWVAMLDYSGAEAGAQFADGSQVRVGDKKALIEAQGLSWPPDEATRLTDVTGQAWSIEQLRELAPAGVPVVMYTANATR